MITEPAHNKTKEITCSPSEDSDHSWHPPGLIESSLCALCLARDPRFLHVVSENSDHTGWMPRLIWVFSGRTCHFVGFVMRRLQFITFLEGYQDVEHKSAWKKKKKKKKKRLISISEVWIIYFFSPKILTVLNVWCTAKSMTDMLTCLKKARSVFVHTTW